MFELLFFIPHAAPTGPAQELQNCPNTTACIHPSWICDGANDCWDNSDEQNCSRNSSTSGAPHGSTNPIVGQPCPASAFQCLNGKCITSAWQCDRDDDCEDAVNGTLSSDEINCDYTCRPDQFKCNNSDCIPSMWRCDGTEDCSDGSGIILKFILFISKFVTWRTNLYSIHTGASLPIVRKAKPFHTLE